MARVRTLGVDAIYEMHQRWISDILAAGDSLLSPGSNIWTNEHLDELQRDFVEQPDLAKDKRFLEKLHDQLAHVSPGAIQLMAELNVVHFLIIWKGAISAAKKNSDIEAILSWMPKPCGIPEDVNSALSPGIVHPGQWVLSRRDTQLTWLIGFSQAWRHLADERRKRLLDDPWALKSFVETISAPSSDSARLALLHLTHPDTFEPIVSMRHKEYILQRFPEFAAGVPDVDRQLLAVREVLSSQYGDGFDWYDAPLVYRWLKRPTWTALLTWLQRIRALPSFEDEERGYKVNLSEKLSHARALLLNGDDGWLQALRGAFNDPTNNLTQWQNHSRFLAWADESPAVAAEALLVLWGTDRQRAVSKPFSPSCRLRSSEPSVPPSTWPATC